MSRERRSYPRYPVGFPLTVHAPDASGTVAFAATATSISPISIEFNCAADLVTALLRQQDLPYTCTLDFCLPGASQGFRLPAQVITFRRLSQQQYVVVLLLRHEDAAVEALLDTLLARMHSVGLD